jgi:hypothetical protein
MEKTIEYYNNLISEITDTISTIVEVSDEEKRRDIDSLRQDIAYIRSLLYDTPNQIDFKKIRIRFYGEYELRLPKYGVEEFDRTLKGEMYFKVIGGNDEFIDIKTNSFPDSFRIRLKYKTLKELTDQVGYAFLIYSRGSERLVGDETKIDFRIIKKS